MLAMPVAAALLSRGLHAASAPPAVEIAVRWACVVAMLVSYARDVRRVRAVSREVSGRLGRVFLIAPVYLWRRNRALGRSQATTWAVVPVLVAAYLVYPLDLARRSYEDLGRQLAARDAVPRCGSDVVLAWLPTEVASEYGVRATPSSTPLQLGYDGRTRRCVVELDTDAGAAIDAFDVGLADDGRLRIASDLRVATSGTDGGEGR